MAMQLQAVTRRVALNTPAGFTRAGSSAVARTTVAIVASKRGAEETAATTLARGGEDGWHVRASGRLSGLPLNVSVEHTLSWTARRMQNRRGGSGGPGEGGLNPDVSVRARRDEGRMRRDEEGRQEVFSKSPLQKAVDSTSEWIGDVSASVAKSVPPAVDKARYFVSTQAASLLPYRLRQMLPPLSSDRLLLLLVSSALLLLLLSRMVSLALSKVFAPLMRAFTPDERLQRQEVKAEQAAQQQQKTQIGKGSSSSGGDRRVEIQTASETRGIHQTLLAVEMQMNASGRRSGNPRVGLDVSMTSSMGRARGYKANCTDASGNTRSYKSTSGEDGKGRSSSNLVPNWWQEACDELCVQDAQSLAAAGSESSLPSSESSRSGQSALGSAPLNGTKLAIIGALEQFNSRGHIPPKSLLEIWAAWKASGDTWETQRDSVRMIVFDAAIQLALDRCTSTETSLPLPASGPSFLAAMATGIGLPAPLALEAVLRRVVNTVANELLTCNELIEANKRGEAEVRLQGIANLFSEFTPPGILPEMISLANLLNEMLPRRQREELAWMYEKTAGLEHVVVVQKALGLGSR